MIEAAAAIAAIFGAVGAVTAVLRDWDTGPKLVITSVMIVGVVVLGAAALGVVAAGDPDAGAERPIPPSGAVGGGTATIPPDPTDSEEYRDCSRNAGYGIAECELLRDEETGPQARVFYRDCRASGYDAMSCLDAWREAQ